MRAVSVDTLLEEECATCGREGVYIPCTKMCKVRSPLRAYKSFYYPNGQRWSALKVNLLHLDMRYQQTKRDSVDQTATINNLAEVLEALKADHLRLKKAYAALEKEYEEYKAFGPRKIKKDGLELVH
jgi:hypothetical protein